MIEKAYGCLIGSAIGDAMGMPASFMSPEKIKHVYKRITDFLPPDEEQIAHGSLLEGEITDDTEESLIIAEVLVEAGCFDEALFVKKMKSWAVENKMLESTVIGPSTRRFLEAIVNDADLSKVGQTGDTNGGAMRVAPIGIFYHGDVDQTIKAALASAKLSHGSKPGLASTAAVAAAIAVGIDGGSVKDAMEAALRGAQAGEAQGYDIPAPSVYDRIRLAMNLVDQNQDKNLEEICYILYRHIGASMKSYESIPLSLGVFYAGKGDFQECLIATINIGDDADTNGAIVGALCGAFSGADKIKSAWIDKIQQTNHLDFYSLANKLLQGSK